MIALAFVLTILWNIFIVRCVIVYHHREWVREYMNELKRLYFRDEKDFVMRLLKEKEIDGSIFDLIYGRIWRQDNIDTLFKMYPSFIEMVFSLDKWKRFSLFPNLALNFGCALADKLDHIDEAMLK